jgi:predicted nucleotidyltransferase
MIHNKYFEIMNFFLNGYDSEIYGREIISKVKISQKNVAITLSKLEEEGILSSKIKGNLRHYFLNRKNPLIDKYLISAELQKAIDFLKNKPLIREVVQEIDAEIVCIFGSYAKGTEKKDSDVDIFVIGNFDEKKVKKKGELFNLKLNIFKGSLKNFRDSLKKGDLFVSEILKNHVIVKGYETFIKEVIKQRWKI